MKNIHQLSINTLRLLAVDAIEKAKSGHPGLPMGAAPAAYALWADHMKFSPGNPHWPNRDRFILSAGHGSMLLYGLLHLFNFDVTLNDLKEFRQWGSKTPGHPEYGHTPGVETTTGPLGQGFATAVGMAIAEERMAAEFNTEDFKIVDNYTYVLAGDGDMMEGVASEAASLAGHLKLGKLICLYDDNNITIDGDTSITFTEDVMKRFESYGWEVMKINDGNDYEKISKAIAKGKENNNQPTLIIIKTQIGYGSPNKAGKPDVHGAPLGKDEVELTKKALDWPADKDFYIPQEVKEHFYELQLEKEQMKNQWIIKFEKYREKYPEKAKKWDEWHNNRLPEGLIKSLLAEIPQKAMATRSASGQIMNIIAKSVNNLMGGSADLNSSTKTYLKGMGDFTRENRSGNNIFFGVREHAMGAICNGISLYGGLKAFGSTFMIFSDYLKPSIRLSALMRQPVIYVFTHDSIGVGEDGPTHQPIEQMVALRSIPNINVIRPADYVETAAAWFAAIKSVDRPTALVLTRQDIPQVGSSFEGALKGAYIIGGDDNTPDIIIMASGSEVKLALEAKTILESKGNKVRVVSMPCWELFEMQPEEYKEKILPKGVKARIAVEAGTSIGWHKYIGIDGKVISIDFFGASAPGNILMEKFGFTVDNIVKAAEEIL